MLTPFLVDGYRARIRQRDLQLDAGLSGGDLTLVRGHDNWMFFGSGGFLLLLLVLPFATFVTFLFRFGGVVFSVQFERQHLEVDSWRTNLTTDAFAAGCRLDRALAAGSLGKRTDEAVVDARALAVAIRVRSAERRRTGAVDHDAAVHAAGYVRRFVRHLDGRYRRYAGRNARRERIRIHFRSGHSLGAEQRRRHQTGIIITDNIVRFGTRRQNRIQYDVLVEIGHQLGRRPVDKGAALVHDGLLQGLAIRNRIHRHIW